MDAIQLHAAGMLVGLLTDVALGWPRLLFNRIGHPVSWIGRLISDLEVCLNRPSRPPLVRRILGATTFVVVILFAFLIGALSQGALPEVSAQPFLLGILAWPFLASKSLHSHVLDVALPLEAGNIQSSRNAVSMIVGRDPGRLDESGIARATIESLAENSSDGVIAPLFWGLIGGLPGIMVYKSINTLDSMIGHRTERLKDFGYASAKIDDLVNLVPARLSGVLISLSSGRPLGALRCMIRDAHSHRSPNAGWPEAAMAGALGVRLSGPRAYEEGISIEPWLNGGERDPTPADLFRALGIYRRTIAFAAALLASVALLSIH